MDKRLIPVVILVIASISACTPWRAVKPTDWVRSASDRDESRCRLAAASSSVISIRNFDDAEYAFQDPDVAVVDFIGGDNECGDVSALQMERFRARSDKSKPARIVLAWLNVGRAENLRINWFADTPEGKCTPSVMSKIDLEIGDDASIDFTHPGWLVTMAEGDKSYIRRIVDLGFDGVVLGGIDAVRGEDGQVVPEKAQAMFELVKAISVAAREKDPDFMVVATDPLALSEIEGSMDVLSGVLTTDLIMQEGYFKPEPELTPVLETLNTFRDAGIPVISAEFIIDPIQQTLYQNLCARMGYLCFITNPDFSGPGLAVQAGNGGSCE